MKAIILAAGRGTRLAPYTNDKPKAMVEIGGKPLIRYAIDNLRSAGIEDINIVTGYRADKINFSGVNYIHNEKYAETNMVYSLFCAESIMDDDLIVCYADIVFENRVLRKLLCDMDDIAVALDDDWQKLWKLKPGSLIAGAETLKLDKNNYIIEIGDTPKSLSQIDSQYIGLLRFSKEGINTLKKTYHKLRNTRPGEVIIRGRAFGQIYMTDILQVAINEGNRVKGVRVNGGWFEVDSKREYEGFVNMRESGRLDDFCVMEK